MPPARRLAMSCTALLNVITFTGVLSAVKADQKIPVPGPFPEDVLDSQTVRTGLFVWAVRS